MHNLRIFFMGSPALGLDFNTEVPRCNSLVETDLRGEQIRFRGEAQESGFVIAASIQRIKTGVNRLFKVSLLSILF
jgi:hypothetical protein